MIVNFKIKRLFSFEKRRASNVEIMMKNMLKIKSVSDVDGAFQKI